LDLEKAIVYHLREKGWQKASDIQGELYPRFQEQFRGKDTFKRIVFRALKRLEENGAIVKNFHAPFYDVKRRPSRFTRQEIDFIKKFFDIADHPYKYYRANLRKINQYPDIPLAETSIFKDLRIILSRLWEDPRNVGIVDLGKEMKRLRSSSH
jgi:hypothetical protein